jgi:glycosyltransferase involved in cell wall biosynthesis
LRQSLAARADAQGLSRSVTFVGPLAPPQLPDWYRAAHLTVLSSWSEGIPNVLRESVACGTPFVATRVGDIAEFSPETASDLVPPGDPGALADAIGRALADRGNQPVLTRATTWHQYAEAVADVMAPATGRRPVAASPAPELEGRDMIPFPATGSSQ